MRTDFCAICGAESVVSDPESKPPYVHLSCVHDAGNKNPGPFLTDAMGMERRGKPRDNLHPAVFETYYRPVKLAGLAPSEGQIRHGGQPLTPAPMGSSKK